MPVDGNDAREAEVNSCGEEGGSNGQPNEVDDEVVVVEIVLPEHDAPDVADDLKDRATNNGDEVAPCAVFDGEDRADRETEDEDC